MHHVWLSATLGLRQPLRCPATIHCLCTIMGFFVYDLIRCGPLKKACFLQVKGSPQAGEIIQLMDHIDLLDVEIITQI